MDKKGAAQDHAVSPNVKGAVESAAHVDKPASDKPDFKTDSEAHETETPVVGGTKSTKGATARKSDELVEVVGKLNTLMENIQKSLEKRDEEFTKLAEKAQAPQTRKSHAVLLEKNFEGYDHTNESKVDENLMEKMRTDKDVSFAEYHKYVNFGELPTKYKKSEKKAD